MKRNPQSKMPLPTKEQPWRVMVILYRPGASLVMPWPDVVTKINVKEKHEEQKATKEAG